jgi:hypothetical protein
VKDNRGGSDKFYKHHQVHDEKNISCFRNAKHIEIEGENYIFKNHPDVIIRYIKELKSTAELHKVDNH